MRPVWSSRLAVSLSLVHLSFALAAMSVSTPEHVERGYAHLAQARIEGESALREQRLSMALAAFKAAYQTEAAAALPASQVHALLGAAQAHLLVQSPRRVFPFLWQATPLQRAEKNLQQALVLQPDNAAATLLLGVVYWRQATQASGQQSIAHERSRQYLRQATVLGIPLRVLSATGKADHPESWFDPDDPILALRYMDARGVGRLDDLILVYRSVAREAIFGVMVTGQQAHPLTVVPATGALAQQGLLEAITTVSQPDQRPILRIRLRQGPQVLETHFLWNGTRFTNLPAP